MDPAACPFCSPSEKAVVLSADLCYAIYDRFPVSDGHMLVIPYRHAPSWFDLEEPEQHAMIRLLDRCRAFIEERHHPDGYNFGVNIGSAAGQTVPHVHMHIIPRYRGDVRYARGGIRSVIPDKRPYPPDMPEE
ncbi:MAG: HIT domain-containing protein [Methanomicrobiales archaeon]|nr:HIT domain-containing protein [Methanomicrobiales archaeon]